MTGGKKPISAWKGEFGDSYVDRNRATPEAIANIERALAEILRHMDDPPPATILEVGANIGVNLRALSRLTGAELTAVEPNAKARRILIEDSVVPAERAVEAVATALPFPDGGADLVFTSGVLIHVPPEDLETACREINRVAGRHVLSIEYFSDTPVSVPYRGREGLLFKRDFGAFWLDHFPELKPVANGFFWKRTTGLDNTNWWLFAKP